jgi:hypothetical protein
MSKQRLLTLILAFALLLTLAPPATARAQNTATDAPPALPDAAGENAAVLTAWFDLILELIRQTPGFSPPVASRALGYAGVTAYEAVVPGIPGARSLAGQLNELSPLPPVQTDAAYHWPSVANAALGGITRRLFAGGGGAQRAAIDGLEISLRKRLALQAPAPVVRRSIQQGRLVAAAIYTWSRTDGGHEGYFFNTPLDYVAPVGAELWAATPPGYLRALQPYWGQNRPFLLTSGGECAPPPPPEYSTDPASAMYQDALGVYETVRNLTPEQREIALFWADDPNLTATPPGHSIAIATQVLRDENASLALAAEAYARTGIAVADAFIGCWYVKYQYNRIRPIQYIQANIDPAWNSPAVNDPVITPPFPEYPSGHSTEIAAAATVLAGLFGDDYLLIDRTQERLGFAPRVYASFDAAAEEAAVSRLYGGIHYPSGNEAGLAQGKCIGARVAALEMGE